MYYSCRPFIGARLDNSYAQFWENEKQPHLFGLIISTDIIEARQIIENINQTNCLPKTSNSQIGLLSIVGNKIYITATADIFIGLKRKDKTIFFPIKHGETISGTIHNLDQFLISNSRKFPTSNIIIPDNTAAVLIEIHDEDTKMISQHSKHIPTHHRFKFFNIFFIIFFFGLIFGTYSYLNHYQKQKRINNQKVLIEKINEKIKKSQAIKNMDLELSAKEASSAATLLNELKTKFKNNNQISTLENSIKELLNPFEIFYDLKIINESAKYSKMILSKDGLYLLDTTSGRLDFLSFSKSKKEISKSEKIKSIFDIALDRDKLYGLSLDKVYLLNGLEFDETSTFKNTPIDFQVYNGSIYVLTTQSIEKLNSSTSWLLDGQTIPSDPTSIAINGKVWVLNKTGKLTPFFRGKEDNFKQSEKLSLENAANLTTSLTSEDLIFTDQKNIYIFEKTGKLKNKQSLPNLTIVDIVADFGNKSLFVLASDQKIYKISL